MPRRSTVRSSGARPGDGPKESNKSLSVKGRPSWTRTTSYRGYTGGYAGKGGEQRTLGWSLSLDLMNCSRCLWVNYRHKERALVCRDRPKHRGEYGYRLF